MLFTNKTLELINTEEGRKLEMTNVYEHNDLFPVDENLSEKVTYVKDGVVHKYLSLENNTLTSNKVDRIDLILDSLDYKFFKCNGRFEVAEGDKDKFVKNGEIKYKNRIETRTYGIDLVSINSDVEQAVGRITMTSGICFYVIKNKNSLVCLTHGAAIKYIKEKKLDIILKDIKFVQL